MRQNSAQSRRCTAPAQVAAKAVAPALCLAVLGCGGGGSASSSTNIQPRSSAALVSLYEPADVVLDWTAPGQRADATALGPLEIKGYQICYVGSDGRIVLIPDAREDLLGETSYTIKGLRPDTYQFNVFAIDQTNLISEPSETVAIQIDQFPRR